MRPWPAPWSPPLPLSYGAAPHSVSVAGTAAHAAAAGATARSRPPRPTLLPQPAPLLQPPQPTPATATSIAAPVPLHEAAHGGRRRDAAGAGGVQGSAAGARRSSNPSASWPPRAAPRSWRCAARTPWPSRATASATSCRRARAWRAAPAAPVCVTSNRDIDTVIALARIPNVTIATFGDMTRVPGSTSSLLKEQAAGRSVQIVYSPLDALALAAQRPEREIVFVGVGFETTTPLVAMAIKRAAAADLKNLHRVRRAQEHAGRAGGHHQRPAAEAGRAYPARPCEHHHRRRAVRGS